MQRLCVAVAVAALGVSSTAFAQFAYSPVSPTQLNTDGTALCIGCTSKNTSVRLNAQSNASSCGNNSINYWMEYEVRPIGTAFTGTATHQTATYKKNQCIQASTPTVDATALAPGSYHWRVEERSSYPDYSGWVDFNSGLASFSIAGAPTKLAVTSPAQTLVVGQCSAGITIEQQDASNIPAPATAAVTVALTPTGGNFYSNSSCTTVITSSTIAIGSASTTVYYSGSAVGSWGLTASATGRTAATQTETVNTSKLVFTTAQQIVALNTCSALTTIQSQTGSGAASNVAANTTVTLFESSGNVQFFSDGACTSGISNVTIAAGTSAASFYFKSATYGQYTMTASATQRSTGTQLAEIAGPASAEQPYQAATFGEARYTIDTSTYKALGTRFKTNYPGTIERLCAYIQGTSNIRLFSSSGAVLATAVVTGAAGSGLWRCVYINPVAVTAGSSYDVAVEHSGTQTFYSDDACYSACTAAYLPSTRGSVTVEAGCYVASPTADPCVTNRNTEVTEGLVDIGFTPTKPTALTFTTSAVTQAISSCSAPLTVATNLANPPSNGAITVNLSSSLGGLSFYADTDTTCATPITTRTIAAGGSTVSFRLKGTTAGSATLTASATSLTSATQTATLTGTRLRFTTAPPTFAVGACSPLLTVQNESGASVAQTVPSPTVISFSSSSPGGQFFTNATCTTQSPTVTMNASTSSVTVYYRDDTSGQPTLTASATGIAPGTLVPNISTCNTGMAPWQSFYSAVSSYTSENYNEGYGFTPLKPGSVTQLCSNHDGTAPVTLYRRSDGAVLAQANVTSNRNWVCVNISPVPLQANVAYSVATYLSGAANQYAGWVDPTNPNYPVTSGDVRIDASCFVYAAQNEPCSESVSTSGTMYGMPDITFAADRPTSVAITSPAQTISAGACSGISTATLRGCNSSTQKVGTNTTISLSASSGTFSFYAASDTTCATPLTAVSVLANDSATTFRFKDTTAGSPVVTVSSTGLTPGTQTQTITSSGATRVAFSSAAQTLNAGACSGAESVQSRDAANNPANVTSATTVNLSSSSTGYTFYSDSGCTASITSVVINAGTSSSTVYFKETKSGTPTHTASAAGLTSGTLVHTINALAPSKVAFSSSAQTVTAGGCAPATTVQSRDGFDNAANVGGLTTVNLSSSLGGVTFYSNSTCTTSITSTTIAAGGNSATFYWRGNTSGSTTFTASATGLTSGAQVQTINAAAATLLGFTTAGRTVAAGGCSAVVTVQSRDTFGNASNVGAATTVNLASTSGGATFYSDPSCLTQVSGVLIASGSNSASYYFKDTLAGATTHTVSATGLTAGAQGHTVTAGAATKLAFLPASLSLIAGDCSSALTVQSQDPYGNPAVLPAGAAVTLTETSTGGAFSSLPTCGTATTNVTIAAGASSVVVYYSDTVAGTPTLTATASGLSNGLLAPTVSADAPAALVFTSSAQTRPVGSCSNIATVQLRDAFNNVAPAATSTSLTLGSSRGTTVFNSDVACNVPVGGVTVAVGASTASFYFEDTQSGAATLTVSGSGLTSATQTANFTAGTATTLAFSNPARTVTAGACSATSLLSVQSRDNFGNASNVVAATTVTPSGSNGATFYSDSSCLAPAPTVTLAAATNTVTLYFKATVAGTATLNVTASGFSNGTQAETVNASSVTKLAFQTAAQTVAANNCSAITTLRTKDTYDNDSNVAAATTVNLTSNAGTTRFYSDAACTAQVTSVTVALGSSTASFYFKDTAQGSPALTASATGLTPATQTQTISAGSATKLAFLTSSQSLVAGNCSGVMTVQSQDTSGNPVNVPSAVTVSLSSTSTTATFYSDATCTTVVTTRSIAVGTSSTSFYYRDNSAGTPTVTASATGYTNAAQTQTISAGNASALGFSSAAQTLTAGACSGATTVQSRDAFGNVSPVTAATVITPSSSSTGETFYSDATCTTVVTSVTLAATSSQVSFYWKDTVAGSPSLTASATGFTPGTQVQTVTAGTAAQIGFTTPARTMTAGGCSAVLTVQSQDAFGNAVNVASATGVSLSGSSTTFYSDSTCTTVVATVTIAAGGNSANFYIGSTFASTRTLTASATGFTAGTQSVTVNPATPTKLVFSTGSATVTAGACAPGTNVRFRDQYNNNANVAVDTVVTLGANMGGLTWYSNSTCTTAITTTTVTAGTSFKTVYWRATLAGSPTLTDSATGYTPGSQVQTVNPAAATKLGFTSAAQTLTAGNCSGQVTVKSQDPYDNPSNLAAATAVNLSSSSAGNTFFSDASCSTPIASVTIAAAANTATFYFRDTDSGASTLSASATGLTTGTQVQTLDPAAATQLSFTTAPQSVNAGGCSGAVTVQSRDIYANASPVAAATTLSLSSSSGGNTFYSDAACGTAITQLSLPAGQSQATFYFRDNSAGAPVLTVSAASLGSAAQTQTITSGSATRLAFSNAPFSVTAGTCSGALSIQSRDNLGNATAVTALTTVTLSSSAGSTVFYADSSCASAVTTVTLAVGQTTQTAYFRDNTAGSPLFTAAATGFSNGTQTETINAAAPTRLAFRSAAQTVLAGACSGATVVERQDAFNNATTLGGALTVSLSSSSTFATFYSDSACTSAASTFNISAGLSATTLYWKDTRTGTPTLTASATGLSATTQAQTVNAAAASALVVTSSAQTLTAGNCSAQVSFQVRDGFGNQAPGVSARSVSLGTSSSGGLFYSDSLCTSLITTTTVAAGAATGAFFFKDTRAGTSTLTLSSSGLSNGTQTATINAAAASAIAFSSAAQTLTAGNCSSVAQLETRDAFGNPSNVTAALGIGLSSSPASGAFFSDSACGSAIASVTVPSGARTANFYFKQTQAGAATLTASASGFASGSQVETINSTSPNKLVITTSAQTLTAGSCSAAVTVQVQDVFSNPSTVAAAQPVNLTSSSTGGTFHSDPACGAGITGVTIGAGATSATFYWKDSKAGTPALTVTASGLTTGSQPQTVNAAAVSKLSFVTASQTVTAGSCSAIQTVQSRDSFDNASPVGAATTVTLSSSSGAVTFYSDPSCTTAVGSVTIAGGATNASMYFKEANAGSFTHTGASGSLTSATLLNTVNPAPASRLVFTTAAQTVTAGNCSGTLTVQSQNNSGVPTNVAAATTLSLSSTSAQTVFYSDATCTTAVSSVVMAAATNSKSFWFKDTLAGGPTFTASATGFTNGAQSQTVNPAAASLVAFTSAPQTVVAGGCSLIASIQTRDTFGNAAPGAAARAVTLSSNSPGGTFYADAACTTAIAGVTIAAGSSVSGFYFKDTRAGTSVITAASSGLSPGTQNATVTPATATRLLFSTASQSLTAGACSNVVTVQSQDTYGNVAPVTVATAVSLSSSSTGNTFYSNSSCGTVTAGATLAAGASTASFYFKDTRVGSPSLTASATGFTSGSQSHTISAASATVLAFSTAPLSLTAGNCSPAITVQSRDAFGNTSTVTANTTVSLATGSTGGTFYSNGTCTTVVTGVTVSSGSSSANLYYRDTRAGSSTVTASATGFTSGNQTHTITAAPASRLVFTSSPQTLTAGSCSASFSVQTQDNFGNVSAVTASTTVTLTSSSTQGTFYNGASCNTSNAGQITLSAGSSSGNFFYGDTRAGSATLTASGASLAAATQTVTVNAASGTKLVFTSAPQTVNAGSCSLSADVQVRDAFDNPSAGVAARTVTPSSSSGTTTFFSDAACGTSAASFNIPAGSAAGSFFFKGTVAGSFSLNAASAGLTTATQGFTLTSANPTKLAFVSASQTLPAGSCSGAVVVQAQDGFNNAATVASATTVTMSSSSTGATFFSDSSCGTSSSTAVIASGQTQMTVYFRDTVAGAPTVSANAAGLTASAQVETINPAAASRLVFTTSAQTVTAGSCSGALALQSRDAFGNPSSVASATSISLTSSSAQNGYFSDSSCTTPVAGLTLAAGGQTATVYFRDTLAGSPTLTASATGFAPATQGATVNPAAATVLTFQSSPQTVVAGQCSAVATLRAQDAFGNPSPVAGGKTVTLSVSGGALQFYSDAACGTATTTTNIGASATTATFYFKDTVSGARTLTASASGMSSAAQTATINPSTPAALFFVTSQQTLAAGSCSAVTTLVVRDSFGNVAPVSSAAAVNLSSTSTGGTFYSDPACGNAVASATIAAGQSGASFYFRDTRAGTPTLTAASSGLASGTQPATINAAAATRLVYATGAQSLTAGNCSNVATVRTEDAFGNLSSAASATTLSLSTSSSAGAFYSDSGCATLASTLPLAAGANTASFYFKDTRAGAPTLTASAPGYTAANQNQTISAAAPFKLSFTSLAQTVTAGGCSSGVAIQAQDAFNNPSNVLSATTVTLSSTSGSLAFSAAAGCGSTSTTASIALGTNATTFWFQDTTAGTPTIDVSASGLQSATQTATVNPAPAARLAFTTSPQTLTVGNCSAVATVRSQDNLGNPSPVTSDTTLVLATTSTAGTFYSDSSCLTPAPTVTLPNGGTTASFYFKDTKSGAPTLTASSTGFASATQTQTLNAGNPARVVFVSSPQSFIAGNCSALYTVRVEDGFGNTATVAAATTVTLATSSPGGGFFSNAACSTASGSASIAASQSTATFYYRDTRSGAPQLTATVSGITPATQTQTLSPASVSKLVITTPAQTLTAGACSSLFTVQAQDAFDNPSPVTGATSVALSSSAPNETFASDSSCGTAVASATIPGGQTSANFYLRDTKAGSWTLTASSGALVPATQGVTVNPATANTLVITSAAKSQIAGACSTAVTFVTQDAFGNLSNVAAATAVNLASSSAGNTFYSDSACGTAATSVAVAAGSSTQSYYFKDSLVGAPTHTLTATGLGTTTQTHSIGSATPTVLAFTSAAPSLVAGACSGQLSIRTRDQFGNTANVTSNTTLTLATNSTGGAFYSDATCSTVVTTASVASGQSTASFYYRDTRSGSPLLTISSSGYSSATQTGTITPAAATRLAFTSSPLNVTAGNCSTAVSLQSQDSFGNPSNVTSALTASLSTDSPGGGFFSDSACGVSVTTRSIAVSANAATFFYRDTRAGSSIVTATAAGFTTATQTETISSASPTKLVFTNPARSLVAGACAPASTVQRQDTYGNAASGGGNLALTLTSSSAGNTFYSNSTCTTALSSANISGGQTQATFYWLDTRSGSPTHTVTGGSLTPATQTHTLAPNTPVKIVFTTSAQTRVAGACSGAVTVQTQDTYSNGSPVAANTTVTLATTSAGGTFYSDSSCLNAITQTQIASGASATTFFFKDVNVGTPTLTVNAAGITAPTATQTETINSAPATRLVFSTSSQSLTAGNCSAQVTFRTQDAFGNLSNVTAATPVTLSSTSARGTFYSDAACSTAISGATVANGSSTGTFYWKDLNSGTPALTLSATGFSAGTQGQTVSPNSPYAAAFINPARTFVAGNCSGALQLRIQDVHGNASPVSSATTLALQTSSTAGSFFSDSSCTTPMTSATIAASASDVTVFYGDTLAGTHTLTLSTAGLQSGTQAITVSPAPAVTLTFTTPPRSQAAGDCSQPLTLQSRDAYGNASPVPSSTLVTLSSTSSEGAFYADPSCNAPAAGVTLVVGTSQVTFYYQDTKTGAPTLTAQNTGLGNATQGTTIAPAPAARVVFRTAPQSLPAGSCSGAATVAIEDSFGNDVPSAGTTQVNLTASRGTATLFATSACGTAINTVDIPNGASTATFHFKDTASGTVTLTAAVSGLQAGTQVETLTAAAATVLAFTNSPVTMNAGACSPPLTVQARDGNGNASPVAADTSIALATSATASGAFYSDSSCQTLATSRTIGSGQSQTTFFYKDTAVGAPTLTASASGLSNATQTLTVTTAGTATRLVFLTPPRSISAGGCSLVATVQTQDSFGNAVNAANALSLSLSSNSAQGAFFSDAACGTALTSLGIASGQNSASFYYRDTRAGSPTVTVAATGLSNGAQVVTVSAGAPSRLLFTSAAQPFTAGDCRGPFTFITADGFGNASAVSANLAAGLATTSSAGQFFTDSSCQSLTTQATVAASQSVAGFYYRDSKAGAPALTASAAGYADATQQQSIVSGGPVKLAFLSAPQVVAAGGCSGAVTLQLQDAFANASAVTADTTVGLTSTSTTLAFFSDAACTQALAAATVPSGAASTDVFFRDATAGSVTVTASSAGLTSATQTQTIGSGLATQLAYVTLPQSLNAGACSGAITIEMRDALGNPATLGQNLTVVLETDSPGGAYHADSTCTGATIQSRVIPAGQTRVTVHYRDTKAGSWQLGASNPGLYSTTQPVTIAALSPSKLSFLTAPQAMTAGNCSALAEVEAQDAFGNAASLSVVRQATLGSSSPSTVFFSDSGCISTITTATLPATTSRAAFYFRDNAAGTATLTAAVTGLAAATQAATFTTGAAVRVGFGNPQRVITAGTCSQALFVQPQDSAGNAVALGQNAVVSLSASSATAGFFSNSSCGTPVTQVTLPVGSTSATVYVKDTKAGALTVSASTSGLANGTQVETVVGAAAVSWLFTTGSQTLTAGSCSQPVRLQTRDSFGNPSPAAQVRPVLLSGSTATVQFFSDSSCQTALTQPQFAQDATDLTFHFKEPAAGAMKLFAKTNGLADLEQQQTLTAGAASALFIDAPAILGVGACSRLSSVKVGDAQGNAVNVTSARSVGLTSDSPSATFYSDAACSNAITQVTIAANSSSAAFFFKDANVGAITLTASSAPFAAGRANVNVVQPQSPTAIAFVTPSHTMEAGSCSPAVSFEVQDQTGAASPLPAARTFTLAFGSSTFAVFSDATCTTRVTQLPLPAGEYRGTVHVMSPVVESATLSISSSGLLAASQGHTTVCPVAVDGARCDDGNFCNGRETCQAGACASNPADSCDDSDACTVDSCQVATGCTHDVTSGCCQAPRQVASYNTVAAVGVPYRVSPTGRAELERGTGPIRWALCDAPPAGLNLDAVTGAVSWIPPATGPVNLCFQATGACGAEEQRFTVNVQSAPGARPTAALTLSAPTVATGSPVSADGSQSTPSNLFAYEWRFGDGSPAQYGVTTAHTYLMPGSYPVRLRVYDIFGQYAEATDAVAVTSSMCATVQRTGIRVTDAPGAEVDGSGALSASAQITASLEADYAGDLAGTVFKWDFGDGETATGKAVTHTFKPGRGTVVLEVLGGNGCASFAAMPVSISDGARQPPTCALSADPTSGPAPLVTTFIGTFGDVDGAVTAAGYSFSDGVSSDALLNNALARRTLERVGALTATLTVIDDHGLACRASATVRATNKDGLVAPEITSKPTLTAQCGVPYVYGADGHVTATGTRPLSWSVGRGDKGAPEGFTVSEEGVVSWTPAVKAGPERVTLVAENAAGAAQQDFVVEVECDAPGARPCGCSAFSVGPMMALAALGLLLRRRRSRSG